MDQSGGGSGRRRITVSKNGIAESSVETQVSLKLSVWYNLTWKHNLETQLGNRAKNKINSETGIKGPYQLEKSQLPWKFYFELGNIAGYLETSLLNWKLSH